MNTFEQHLISHGISYGVAARYSRMINDYNDWLSANGLTPRKVKKRSQFSQYIKHLQSLGNGERTIETKETAIKKYYEFLGAKHNPAHRWQKRKKKVTEPTKPLEKEELQAIYENLKPSTPVQYRDRCILGLILFQGLMRQDVAELRVDDIDFELGEVSIIGKKRTNARKLKLEAKQVFHLYDYINKYRAEFLACKNAPTDMVFLSKGTGNKINNALTLLLRTLKLEYPKVKDFEHLRTSVISLWEKEDGIIEAKVKAGHRYVMSTDRYRTDKEDELKEELLKAHPFINMNI